MNSPVPQPGSCPFRVVAAHSPEHIPIIRELFLEYATSLGFSLCFQSFDQELKGLPGDYAPPTGRLLLAQQGDRAAGCVAMRRLEDGICEMKRLYVRTEFRGRGVGRALAEFIIDEARRAGYGRMRLDTVEPRMGAAVALYRNLGFYEIAAYNVHPIPGTLHMEILLTKKA